MNHHQSSKPEGFSREENDQYSQESRLSSSTSAEYNNPNITIKGVQRCYDPECESNQLEYDFKRDQICCKKCGLVLKEALKDYEEIIKKTTK